MSFQTLENKNSKMSEDPLAEVGFLRRYKQTRFSSLTFIFFTCTFKIFYISNMQLFLMSVCPQKYKL